MPKMVEYIVEVSIISCTMIVPGSGILIGDDSVFYIWTTPCSSLPYRISCEGAAWIIAHSGPHQGVIAGVFLYAVEAWSDDDLCPA